MLDRADASERPAQRVPAPKQSLGVMLPRLARALNLRRIAALLVLISLWQAVAVWQANPILLPTFTETVSALWMALLGENLAQAALASIAILLKGYAIAIVLALVLVSLAVANSFFKEVLATLTAMFNPLPAIALLPLAMLWLGLGDKACCLFSYTRCYGHSRLPRSRGFNQYRKRNVWWDATTVCVGLRMSP